MKLCQDNSGQTLEEIGRVFGVMNGWRGSLVIFINHILTGWEVDDFSYTYEYVILIK
jgi:hypothetical protein